MEHIKWEDVPSWLSPILLLLWIAREHIKNAYLFLFRSSEDKREHQQEIEETRLNSEMQDRASQRLRQREIDNQALAILKESLDWSRKEFSDMEHDIRGIYHGINRNNDLMTLHNQLTAELLTDNKELVEKVKNLIEEIRKANGTKSG